MAGPRAEVAHVGSQQALEPSPLEMGAFTDDLEE